ncbi:MAGUK p55 subfamily member 7 isoform X2 [Culicoides brevitarsis]|uniref:MAGUK p55 subfamily member 7 isoform X2 n=1 Tax=Culicoides brevitarsis TaxID=469753 RepID=UPI00307C8C16
MTATIMANDMPFDPVLSKLISSLNDAETLSGESDLLFLRTLLQSKELNALVTVHGKVAKIGKDDRLAPVLSDSMQVALEVLELLAPRCLISPLCREIFHLLQTPHLQSLLCAHDAIAQKDFYPHLPEIPVEVDETEPTVKIVQLVKSNEPLGATIKTEEETGKIVIARIMHGGAADRSGLIHVGDEVIEVNGINVEGKTPGDVLQILQNSEGTITFKLVPSDSRIGQRESKVRVKAYFDYNPENDPYIPCKEAGLGFQKGDVLHIVSQDDAYWWQARKETEKTARAGLIPSRALQERRIIHERNQIQTNGESKQNDDFDRELIATYDEVAKLYPRPGSYRPIVLIGPPGVGRNELKRRLIARDPEKYRSPVPYTTRPARPYEVPGREYLFVTREKMEADIDAGKFIEHGEFRGHLYGTSADSVKSIIHAGCVCVISPHYTGLKALRTPQLKPFVIHIKTPPLEELKETRTQSKARSTFDETCSRSFTDEEFEDMLKHDKRIEFLYGHYFDDEIVNGDLATSLEKLIKIVNRAETEPNWAPVAWVQ